MVMVGHSERLRQPLRWTRAGRVALATLATVAFAALAALAVALSSGAGSRPLPRGCISVTFPSTVGGATLSACGTRARNDCAHPARSSLGTPRAALQAACARAKLPFDVSS
ncbi:MAG: hypothetical protein ACYCUM_04930 [Solirubrobacteraceae bacterium]